MQLLNYEKLLTLVYSVYSHYNDLTGLQVISSRKTLQ